MGNAIDKSAIKNNLRRESVLKQYKSPVKVNGKTYNEMVISTGRHRSCILMKTKFRNSFSNGLTLPVNL